MTFAAVVPVKRVIVGTGGMHFLGAIKKKKYSEALELRLRWMFLYNITQIILAFVKLIAVNTCNNSNWKIKTSHRYALASAKLMELNVETIRCLLGIFTGQIVTGSCTGLVCLHQALNKWVWSLRRNKHPLSYLWVNNNGGTRFKKIMELIWGFVIN